MWEAASIDELELNGMRLSTHIHVCCSEKGILKSSSNAGHFPATQRHRDTVHDKHCCCFMSSVLFRPTAIGQRGCVQGQQVGIHAGEAISLEFSAIG